MSTGIEPVFDLWSWLSYRWSMWQSDDITDEEESNYLMWLLLPLLAVLAYRVYYRERVTRKAVRPAEQTSLSYPGADSSFYRLVAALESSCRPRLPGETVDKWLHSLDNIRPVSELFRALSLHKRYRFDPAGVSADELREMDTLVAGLLNTRGDWLMLNEALGSSPAST